MPAHILIVDDDEATCELLEMSLLRLNYRVTWRTSPREALDLVPDADFDVALIDLGMSEMNGLELCQRLNGTRPDLPVIVLTGLGSMETAVAALRAGAYDFEVKPIDMTVLDMSINRGLKHRALQTELRRLKRIMGSQAESKAVGDSAAMSRLHDFISRVATSDCSVVVTGETGTGKELAARAIHDLSGKTGPFVAINCAAVPASLLESELFGHVRGAFTDASVARTGLFVEAKGGTLFLDEIGEMPIEVQPKLLRALQERKVRPVGANVEVPFDARLIAATNRDLATEVFERRFREDLYYRINVVKLVVPPLRERGADVLILAQHFLGKFAERFDRKVVGLTPGAAERLLAYNWPGNVRELENAMERAVALTRFEQLTVDDLPTSIQAYQVDRFVVAADETTEIIPMEELERRYVLRVLSLVHGNKTRAAELLGFDRRTLYRKLAAYEGTTPTGEILEAAVTTAERSSVSPRPASQK